MKLIKNEGPIDRAARILLAEIFFLLAFFWFGGVPQLVFYALASAMLLTGIFGFCGVYKLLGVNTCAVSEKPIPKISLSVFVLLFVGILVGGGYASDFFTKKIFLEDYNEMNQYYKQALFFTGQEVREDANMNYTKLVSGYQVFRLKYQHYHPFVISQDGAFNTDLDRISVMIATPKDKMATGDLKSAHLDLELVRPVFQDILKRNGFSMLAVSLVDFHDAMEKIIAASDAKSPDLVVTIYSEVSEKLKAVEEAANDSEIQTIRNNLEQLLQMAKNGEANSLPVKAAELKSSFVKVYLKRG